MVQFGIRIEFRDPETDAPESYVGSMMREGFRLPTLPSPGDGMMGLGYPVLPVAQVLYYPAPHWTNAGMEDGDGPDIDVIVHASASSAYRGADRGVRGSGLEMAPGASRHLT